MTVLRRVSAGQADAPPVLLAGSLGTTLAMWEQQAPLSELFRLIAFDHRGHGGSAAPAGPYTIADLAGDVLELMDDLQLERANYCGLSIGGMIGMWLGIHAPKRIGRLILLCTAAWMPTHASYASRALAVREAGSVEPIADDAVGRWLTPAFATNHPELRDNLRTMLLDTTVEGYAGCCEAIADMDLRGHLPRIEAPTLVVSGHDDPATPIELQRVIASAIPGARHEIVSPAAHLAPIEQPATVNHLIEEFLR